MKKNEEACPMFKKIVLGGAALKAIALASYLLFIRPWHLRWGANDEELRRSMPGDDEIQQPLYTTTRAVTINAQPAEIWPWLVQMGYQRGGLYSYDWLDRLFGILDRPSADRIIPEFQHLQVGDVIPLGAGPSWPVKAIEPKQSLLIRLSDPQYPESGVTWVWALYPLDEKQTRLVSRVRGRLPLTLGGSFILFLLEPTGFIMERKMLLGIKQRAEQSSGRVSEHAGVTAHT
jgi:hypothetical protein